MNSKLKLVGGAALLALAMASATAVYAQETTGAMRGQVTDASGAGVSGATVVIVYGPTNASVTTMSTDGGFFTVRGLRVGGPYSVRTTLPSGETNEQTVGGVSLGDPTQVDVSFASAVSAVVVTATSAAPPTQGLGTNFTANDIANLPSIGRDLKDAVRLDPFATIDPTNQDALSFAGTNTRFNQITVDGIRLNDDFGLNNNGYPTQRSPISTEAIAGMQVSVAPYSTVNNGFTGGSVNAVIKSGSNTFHGALYGDKTSNDMRGDEYVYYDTRAGSPTRGSRVAQRVVAPFDEQTWGANIGGPILRDRLFFFLSYEKYEGNFGLDEGPADSGRGTVIPRISQAAIDTFQAATIAKYGVDPGNWVKSTPPITDEKMLGKLDWDINADHRLSFTWLDTKGASFNGSVSDLFAGGDSTTQPRIGLSTYQYVKDEHLTNYTVQVNSRWSDNLSTELRLGKKETETVRTTFAPPGIGEITVVVSDLAGVATGSGTPQIRFGSEINSQPNYLSTKTDTAEFRARYSMTANEFLIGGRIEHQDILNIFGRAYLPSYTFNSFADYLAGKAALLTTPLAVAVEPDGGTVPATAGTAARNAAAGSFYVNSVYAEDTLQVNDNLTVLAGARVDFYTQDDEPDYNAAFFSRHGLSNTSTLAGKHIVLPRLFAKWTPMQNVDVSAGFGRFSSQGLGVWLLNPIGNSGVVQVNAVCPAGPYNVTNLGDVPANCTATPGNGNTNSLAPSLKIPSAWKTTFSAGYDFDVNRFGLGSDWRVQLDLLHQVNVDSLFWYDLRARQTGVAPDGRPVYSPTTTGTIGANVFDMQLTNLKDGGKTDSAAISLGKAWRDGFFDGLKVNTSYTYTNATDRNPMTSSIADSSYTRFATSDAQNPPEATSDYEVRNKWSMTVAYERMFFGDNKTSINVYAQSRSGLPFSYTFDGSSTSRPDAEFGNYVSSYSGRQAKSNQLLYVPKADGSGNVTATSDPRVAYAPGFDVANFNQFLKNTGLIDYQGRIAARNAFRTSQVTTVDLNLSQEIPAFFPTAAKLLGFVTVENFGNLLNNKWGRLEQYDFYRGVPVVNITCAGVGGTCAGQSQYTYSGLQTAAGVDPATGVANRDRPIRPFGVANGSLWQVKVGLKYQF